MVSAAMAVVQEEHGSPTSDKILLEINITDKCVRFKEQLTTGDDFALKVRKPYTITKQRERWTEEEHKRFLEALKLYGRAWRKIEEHVGTKTAVQIRSHAQKFFSKIVRESNNGDASYAKAIEIPPPRPKRKPMHPYPRKLVSLVKSENSIPEKLTRSVSQDLSMSEQENQSPMSVLSANSSDASAGADSCTPNGSLSPVSSACALDAGTVFGSEVPKVISDDVGSQAGHEDENSNPDEEVPLKMELLSQNDDLVQEDQSAVQCLKLFGKTLLVKDPFGTSYSTLGTCKPECLDKSEGNSLFPWQVIPLNFPASPPEYVLRASNRSVMCCNEIKSDPFYPQTTSDNSSPEDTCSPVCLPWLTLCGGASLSTREVHNPTPIKAQLSEKKEKLDKNEQNEMSSSSSNTDLVTSPSDGERSWDVDSFPSFLESTGNVEKSFSSKLRKRTSANSEDCRKGFVPYKRCSPEQDFAVSSTETAEELEKQRSCIHL